MFLGEKSFLITLSYLGTCPFNDSGIYYFWQIARLERESTDGHYKQTLFSRVGLIYVSGRSSPPRPQLVQLIKLCGGHVSKMSRDM